MRLVIGRFGTRVRVEVSDSSVKSPQINRSTTMRESGNGLFFVEALADDRGCRATESTEGKCVWFAFDSVPRCGPPAGD